MHIPHCVYECLCIRASQCVPSWRREPNYGTLDRRYTPFPEEKETKAVSKWYTARVWRLWEYFGLALDSSSPGKLSCEPTSSTGAVSLIFYGPFNVTIISHSQAVCYLRACADSIWTQLFLSALLVPDRQNSPFPLFPFFIPQHAPFTLSDPSFLV